MRHLPAIIVLVALVLLCVWSLASFIGFSEISEARYLSENFGRTGYVLLIISTIGGLAYWAGRK